MYERVHKRVCEYVYECVHKRVCGYVYECVNKNACYECKCKYVLRICVCKCAYVSI